MSLVEQTSAIVAELKAADAEDREPDETALPDMDAVLEGIHTNPAAVRVRAPMPEDFPVPLACPSCGSRTLWLDMVQVEVTLPDGSQGIIAHVERITCDDCGASTSDACDC